MDARLADGAVPVAAAAHLRPLLTGPPMAARVLISGRLAAYVGVAGVGDDQGHGARRLLAVVAPEAVVPAGAVVLPRGLRPDDVLPTGRSVVVGEGWVRGATALRVARWFGARPVPTGRPDTDAVRLLARRLSTLEPPPQDVTTARGGALPAARALLEGRPDEATGRLVAGLGLGPGATPSGDDVAAGVLLAALVVAADGPRRAAVGRVAAAVAQAAARRTTAVSAALLTDVAEGWCAEPVANALSALTAPDAVRRRAREHPSAALDTLLALGHHSGADLATGLVAVLTDAVDTDRTSPSHTTTRRIA